MLRSTTSCFPDINVWLAVVVERHIFNRRAALWWNQDQSDAIGFCRFTQLGLLRHLTNAATMKGTPLTNGQAWKIYEALQTDARIRFSNRTAPNTPISARAKLMIRLVR